MARRPKRKVSKLKIKYEIFSEGEVAFWNRKKNKTELQMLAEFIELYGNDSSPFPIVNVRKVPMTKYRRHPQVVTIRTKRGLIPLPGHWFTHGNPVKIRDLK